MRRILYFDCYAGISGDLTLGAFLDMGIPLEYLKEKLDLLGISDEFTVESIPRKVRGICGTQADVQITGVHHHGGGHGSASGGKDHNDCGAEGHHHDTRGGHVHGRSLADILALIEASGLNVNTKALSRTIFEAIGRAEAQVHGVALENVHFHEVGAVDSIVDVIGAAICIDYLRPDRICCSTVHDGTGFVTCAHGMIPVPVPAVVELLKSSDISICSEDVPTEMVTPTGMGILVGVKADCCNLPVMAVERSGVGFGTRDTGKAAGLRILFGTEAEERKA